MHKNIDPGQACRKTLFLLVCVSFSVIWLGGCEFNRCRPRSYEERTNAKGKKVKHGVQWRCWQGRKLYHGRYDMGKKVGIFNEWHELSLPYPLGKETVNRNRSYMVVTPKSQEVYKDGKLHGRTVFWYRSGQIQEEATYVKGKLHGSLKRWNRRGRLLEEKTFVHGEPRKHVIHKREILNRFSSRGNISFVYTRRRTITGTYPHKRTFRYHGGMKTTIFKLWHYVTTNANKKKIAEFYQTDGGRKYGLALSWYDNGKKKAQAMYYTGMIHGRLVQWHPNGQKKSDAIYGYGRPGNLSTWCAHGKRLSEGEFVNAKKHRKWTFWAADGSTRFEYYDKGKRCQPRQTGSKKPANAATKPSPANLPTCSY